MCQSSSSIGDRFTLMCNLNSPPIQVWLCHAFRPCYNIIILHNSTSPVHHLSQWNSIWETTDFITCGMPLLVPQISACGGAHWYKFSLLYANPYAALPITSQPILTHYICELRVPSAVFTSDQAQELSIIVSLFALFNSSICVIFFRHPVPHHPLVAPQALTSIPAWISNCIHYEAWGEITYPFQNFSRATYVKFKIGTEPSLKCNHIHFIPNNCKTPNIASNFYSNMWKISQ